MEIKRILFSSGSTTVLEIVSYIWMEKHDNNNYLWSVRVKKSANGISLIYFCSRLFKNSEQHGFQHCCYCVYRSPPIDNCPHLSCYLSCTIFVLSNLASIIRSSHSTSLKRTIKTRLINAVVWMQLVSILYNDLVARSPWVWPSRIHNSFISFHVAIICAVYESAFNGI